MIVLLVQVYDGIASIVCGVLLWGRNIPGISYQLGLNKPRPMKAIVRVVMRGYIFLKNLILRCVIAGEKGSLQNISSANSVPSQVRAR